MSMTAAGTWTLASSRLLRAYISAGDASLERPQSRSGGGGRGCRLMTVGVAKVLEKLSALKRPAEDVMEHMETVSWAVA